MKKFIMKINENNNQQEEINTINFKKVNQNGIELGIANNKYNDKILGKIILIFILLFP